MHLYYEKHEYDSLKYLEYIYKKKKQFCLILAHNHNFVEYTFVFIKSIFQASEAGVSECYGFQIFSGGSLLW